jgi:hypothetical protein
MTDGDVPTNQHELPGDLGAESMVRPRQSLLIPLQDSRLLQDLFTRCSATEDATYQHNH